MAATALIEAQMQRDDETTAYQLLKLLAAKGIKLSISTILRCHRQLRWTYRGAAYCQLIRQVNKEKRLAWAKQYITDDFADVVWTDETTVQLENHRRFCHRKRGQRPKPKPRYSFPLYCSNACVVVCAETFSGPCKAPGISVLR